MELTKTTPIRLEEVLSKLWREQSGKHYAKSSLFTLLVYSPSYERDKYLHLITEKLIEKFPCRIIFVQAQENASSAPIETSVALIPSKKTSSQKVFCEYIEFSLPQEQLSQKIPLLILPYLIQDLPIYLLWGEDPSNQNPLLDHLSEISDKMIFDSENADDIVQFANKLLTLWKKSNTIIADLNWARTKKWRDLFHTTFYDDNKLSLLNNAKNLSIYYNRIKNPFFCKAKVPSLYLQSWIGSQLGWSYDSFIMDSDQNFSFSYRLNDQPISVKIIPQEKMNLQTGAINRIELLSQNNEKVSFDRQKDNPFLVTIDEISTTACKLPNIHLFEETLIGKSLADEIYLRSQNMHLINVLKNISLIKEPLPC